MAESEASELIIRVEDGVGRITLNRPRVLNALTRGMIDGIAESLERWRNDAEVSIVVIDGAGERGLCAGGDIVTLRRNILDGRGELNIEFWRTEYELCATTDEYPKPFIAIMDGITMGGGVGVSAHGSIRVVTERSRIAMPETRIGFAPDVGGTWLLSRAPGELGTYLGLNSATMSGADAIVCGFADYLVPAASLGHLGQALAERADPGTPGEVVLLFDETPPPSVLEAHRPWIDACYSADSVPEIIERLRSYKGERADAAVAAATELESFSPTALTVTLAALRQARGLGSLREVVAQELRTSSWLSERPDLAEGIRAQVVDKDHAPRWSPDALSGVDSAKIAALFEAPAAAT